MAASYPEPKHLEGLAWGRLARVVGNPLLILFGLMLFCQSGNEFILGGWISSYLEGRFGVTARVSAYILSGYWAALMLGRLAASRFSRRIPAGTIVTAGALLSAAAALGLILAPHAAMAGVAVAFAGLGFAAVFPTVLAQAGTAFAEYSATAFGVIFVFALTGGMLGPWSVGRIAQNRDLGSGLWLVVAACAVVAILQTIVRFRYYRER